MHCYQHSDIRTSCAFQGWPHPHCLLAPPPPTNASTLLTCSLQHKQLTMLPRSDHGTYTWQSCARSFGDSWPSAHRKPIAQSAVVVQPAPAAGVPTSRTPAARRDSISRLPAFGHPAEMQAGIDLRMQPMHTSRLPMIMTNAGHGGAYSSQRAGLQDLQTCTDASARAQRNLLVYTSLYKATRHAAPSQAVIALKARSVDACISIVW